MKDFHDVIHFFVIPVLPHIGMLRDFQGLPVAIEYEMLVSVRLRCIFFMLHVLVQSHFNEVVPL